MRFSQNFFHFAQKQRGALDKATFFWYNELYAPVVKLADTMDLGSISARNAGSSPVRRTIVNALIESKCLKGDESIDNINSKLLKTTYEDGGAFSYKSATRMKVIRYFQYQEIEMA